LKGRLLTIADSPDYARADEFFQKSIAADETSGAAVLAARTKYYRADLLARKGEIEPSRSLLHEIQNQFQHWGIPAWQLKCEQALQTIKEKYNERRVSQAEVGRLPGPTRIQPFGEFCLHHRTST